MNGWLLIIPSIIFPALTLFVALWQKPVFVSSGRMESVRKERDDLVEMLERKDARISELENTVAQVIVERDLYRRLWERTQRSGEP